MGFKETVKIVWKTVWECFKRSIAAMFTYFCAGAILMMLTLKGDMATGLTGTRWAWVIVCIVAALAYNGFVIYVTGGSHYEMLVSGNMKRVSAMNMGSEFKISSHKIEKEYRVWKGFLIGAFLSIFAIVGAFVFEANAEEIMKLTVKDATLNKGSAIAVIIFMFLSGWSLLPFMLANLGGASVSYFFSLFLAVLPIIVTGVFYIVGAYGKRAKSIKQQELADKAAAAQAAKPKKINYGGLPGTKPKKRK
jgi:hypothetical protein